MKVLLDTHTFIWWDGNSAQLSQSALAFCTDPQNTVFLSVVSAWEIQIKRQLGKLQLRLPLATVIESQQRQNSIEVLPVMLPHVLALDALPPHHKDPFDRLLIAQAIAEGAALISNDPAFSKYGIDVRW
ncbi:MAG TPA: type II toxin-antitoxin system VapC family toxin [Candidatus Baltobacteraceae bacterium]|nr:type II toxin-antitoxin system VapC family toxin [Candidatus Baltobacteraceae bacterium]